MKFEMSIDIFEGNENHIWLCSLEHITFEMLDRQFESNKNVSFQIMHIISFVSKSLGNVQAFHGKYRHYAYLD